MWDFDPDEWFFLAVASVGALVWVYRYYRTLLALPRLRPVWMTRLFLIVTPAVCVAFCLLVLQCWADSAVRDHPDYLTLFLVGQAFAIAMTFLVMSVLGLSVAENVIDAANPAALCLVVCVLAATTLIYSAANIGGGPTIWTTLLPAANGLMGLAVLWGFVNTAGDGVLDAILIDRDVASALRLGGGAIGCALILARACAGQWIGWNSTFADFWSMGWPAALLAVAVAIVHRILKPNRDEPRRAIASAGLAPAIAYVLIGLLVVALQPHGFHVEKW